MSRQSHKATAILSNSSLSFSNDSHPEYFIIFSLEIQAIFKHCMFYKSLTKTNRNGITTVSWGLLLTNQSANHMSGPPDCTCEPCLWKHHIE